MGVSNRAPAGKLNLNLTKSMTSKNQNEIKLEISVLVVVVVVLYCLDCTRFHHGNNNQKYIPRSKSSS